MIEYAKVLAEQFDVRQDYVENIIALLDEGNTIPFIARYRKEQHGTMDDQTIRRIAERLEYLRGLDARREEVRNAIINQEKMTDEIAAALDKAATLAEIEDIYRPFKQKRRTRASVAKERGLEPLADAIREGQTAGGDPLSMAEAFVDPEKDVPDVQAALAGASDIIAEQISDDAEIRKRIRNLVRIHGILHTVAKEPDENSVYARFDDYSEAVSRIAGHRVLAIDRAEKEEYLRVSIETDPERPLRVIYSQSVVGNNACAMLVKAAGEDAYTRLIYPSVEREIRSELTEAAAEAAIRVFGDNLHQLLMQPPVKGQVTIGLDPGFRTGCKLAVVDATGRVLDTAVIYPTHSAAQIEKSKQVFKDKNIRHKATVIAIGNGTASRETEQFTAAVLREIPECQVAYVIVNEAGASVYSASPAAAAEMPDFDLTLRSAVSIARRLQDPLAELVKIEPKAIGVGQYQHDMPQKKLTAALDGVVEDCVNEVGADLNTASAALLSHISGLNATLCKNIVTYREDNGAFASRAELKKVPKLGPKAFEQCAGFLRVPESANPLDHTAVHPESYVAAKALLAHFGLTVKDVAGGNLTKLTDGVAQEGLSALAAELGIGVPTLQDILRELVKPGRDPRDELPPPMLRTDVMKIEDLSEGMVLKGTVRNVIDFGAFVDIGVHQDGLVHISQICSKFIKHPSEVLKVGDVVTVKILSVDVKKQRIGLTMKNI